MNFKLIILFTISSLFLVPLIGEGIDAVAVHQEVNFDELENLAQEVNAFEKAQFNKPSKILMLVRIVGMPIFNAYLKMTDGMAKISAWFNATFKKNEANVYETRQ